MIGQYEKETLTYRSPQNYLTSRTIKATMTLKQNWTVAISWVQSLKWRTRQIYQHLKKAVEITSHFISVNLIYNVVSTVCGTLKMTFIHSKTLQTIRFANHNSVDEVADAKRGKSARLPSVFPLIGWASRTRFFDPKKSLNRKESNCGISFGTYFDLQPEGKSPKEQHRLFPFVLTF